MKVYFCNENCISKRQVSARDDTTDEERDDNGDLYLYGEGSEAELIALALTYRPVDKEQAEDDEEIGETIVADDRENQPNPIRE